MNKKDKTIIMGDIHLGEAEIAKTVFNLNKIEILGDLIDFNLNEMDAKEGTKVDIKKTVIKNKVVLPEVNF